MRDAMELLFQTRYYLFVGLFFLIELGRPYFRREVYEVVCRKNVSAK